MHLRKIDLDEGRYRLSQQGRKRKHANDEDSATNDLGQPGLEGHGSRLFETVKPTWYLKGESQCLGFFSSILVTLCSSSPQLS